MDLQQAMTKATEVCQEEADRRHIKGINNGLCEDWVSEVIVRVDPLIPVLGHWLEDDHRIGDDDAMEIAHCVLWSNGKWYDSDHTEGVKDPIDLLGDVYEDIKKRAKDKGPPTDLTSVWDEIGNSIRPFGLIF